MLGFEDEEEEEEEDEEEEEEEDEEEEEEDDAKLALLHIAAIVAQRVNALEAFQLAR